MYGIGLTHLCIGGSSIPDRPLNYDGEDDNSGTRSWRDRVIGVDENGLGVFAGPRRVLKPKHWDSIPPTHTVKGIRFAAWTAEEYDAYQSDPWKFHRRRGGHRWWIPDDPPGLYRLEPLPKFDRCVYDVYGYDDLGVPADPASCLCPYCVQQRALQGSCTHCGIDQIRTMKNGLCRWCGDWLREHGRQLPPPEEIMRRRARKSEKGGSTP